MAVTKLMNIKSSSHGAGRHLKNAISYIMNPAKTQNGILIGGNSGTESWEVYQTMLGTKSDWEKITGRQGYHFVLSWKPGETTAETAYQMVSDFCAEYLGDNYDFVFAVHSDQPHIHAHIVFNSVNRETGYKYRYEKGDWEKYIQPVTDRICEKYGLEHLEYDKSEKKGKSYAEHFATKKGKYTWSKIIKEDIDETISRSESWNDFLVQMEEIGYTFPRSGYKETGEYITFCAPGNHRRRSDALGYGYTVADIKKRILGKEIENDIAIKRPPRIKQSRISGGLSSHTFLSQYQGRWYRRVYRLSTGYFRKNPAYANHYRVRKDLLQIERLREDCRYLIKQNIRSVESLQQREQELKRKERFLKEQIGREEIWESDPGYKKYMSLQEQLAETEKGDDHFEAILDQMEELENTLPYRSVKKEEQKEIRSQLSMIRQEKRIIQHIKKKDEEIWKERHGSVDQKKESKDVAARKMNLSPQKGKSKWNRAGRLK